MIKLSEVIKIPIEIGDTVLGGKFKNKRIVVKSIGKNDKGDITINNKPMMKIRLIPKPTIDFPETKLSQEAYEKTIYKKIKEVDKLLEDCHIWWSSH